MNNKNASTKVNNNTGKKGNPNQNAAPKGNPGVIDAKTFAALNAQLAGANSNHFQEGATKGNDISSMMNIAGFYGGGANNMAAALGANNNGMGLNGRNPSHLMMNMNGYQNYNNNPPSMMMGNFQNRQPQVMYNQSPMVHPSSGYGQVPYSYVGPGYSGVGDHAAAATSSQMFNDENTSSCSVM